MQSKDILKQINNIDDKTFMKIYDQIKNRAKKIEKNEKQAIIDKKFRQKGISCPSYKSFKCIKNGFKNDKQKYFCKECKSSFDAFKNHFSYRSKLSHEQWDLLIQITMLGQSSRIIANFINTS